RPDPAQERRRPRQERIRVRPGGGRAQLGQPLPRSEELHAGPRSSQAGGRRPAVLGRTIAGAGPVFDWPPGPDRCHSVPATRRYLSKDEAAALTAAKSTVAPGGASAAPAATYVDLDKAATDRQSIALATVNQYRRLAGLSPVTISSIIHQSALAHAFYTFFNG